MPTDFSRGFLNSMEAGQSGQVMMDLGGLRFGVVDQEYESLRTSMSWRWAEKNRYLRAPALQYQGSGTTTKTLDITIVVEKGLDLEFTPLLQAMGDEGKPYRLVAGAARAVGGANVLSSGSDLGLWCITALDVTEQEFLRDGTAMLIKAALTIKAYGEDLV